MKYFTTTLAVFFFILVFNSCETLPVNYSTSQSWLISAKKLEKSLTTISLLGVQVDRMGGWDSIEKEATSLAPLYFFNQGCRLASAGEVPSYTAGIQIRERELNVGWRTKRSLSVEVRIWKYDDMPVNEEPLELIYRQKLPVAAGRVVLIGEKSFSSSDTTGRMLSRAINQAVRKLSAYERKKDA